MTGPGNAASAPDVENAVTVDSAARTTAEAASTDSLPGGHVPDDSHEAYVALEREVALLLRRGRAIQARLAGQLHHELDGAAYGLLVLLDDAGPQIGRAHV